MHRPTTEAATPAVPGLAAATAAASGSTGWTEVLRSIQLGQKVLRSVRIFETQAEGSGERQKYDCGT
eukprot:362927-Chlamydomonas_euryale.AAC.5